MGESHTRRIRWQGVTRICVCLACGYVLLLIPECSSRQSGGAGRKSFSWSQAQFWASLEHNFVEARGADSTVVSNQVAQLLSGSHRLLAGMTNVSAQDPRWSELETNLLKLAPLVGAAPARLPEFALLVNGLRREAKHQSSGWDLNSDAARERLYRLLYGSRMALEEVLLQNPEAAANVPAECDAEPSPTPSAVFRAVTLHSGDILVSRGDAPTSALIARGNDFAGAFSHVSLLQVDSATGAAFVIQAVIEKGVVVTPLEEYSNARKLRLVVLRPRADLAAVTADPQLPHKAATLALKEAVARHTPYDFVMDYRDHSALFCSEVVSTAYERYGMRLCMGMSHVSSLTLTAWLGSLGVRHFETAGAGRPGI
jgi:Permuted papain-like amidase enzyme, YaeF/YiiX, C92 family